MKIFKTIHRALYPSAQSLAERQLEELRCELLATQRNKDHYIGRESGLRLSIERLERQVAAARGTC